ncbi:MAG: Ger(x)C family spore germination protein [Bacillota bacterium]
MWRKIIVISCLLLIFNLVGCYDRIAVEERGIVVGVGIDKAAKQQIELTVQVIKPANTKEDAGSKGEAVVNFSLTDDTVFSAVREITKQTGQKLFWSHNMVIIVGEELAEEGLADYLDFFNRDPELRRRSYMVIAKGTKAKDILEVEADLEEFSATEICRLVESGAVNARVAKVDFHQFISKLATPNISPFLPGIELTKQSNQYKMNGLAMFKQDKLATWLVGNQSRALLFVVDQVKSGIIKVDCPQQKQDQVSIEITGAEKKIKPYFVNEEPVVDLEVTIKSNLGSQESSTNLVKVDQLSNLEKKVKAKIKTELRRVIAMAQNKEIDIFGLSSYFHREHPQQWSKLNKNWEQVFNQMKINIDVAVEIEKSGLNYGPVIKK